MAFRAVPYLIVDAFTDRPFSGNPAGVVLDARGLRKEEMQAIAREVNLSETAFLTVSSVPECRYRLRFFTPTQEIALCGHATVATYAALAGAGGVEPGARFLHETGFGPLPVEVRSGDAAGPLVMLGGEPWSYEECPVHAADLARLLGLPESALSRSLPPAKVCGRHLIAPLRDLESLDKARPDLPALAELSRAHGLVGLAAFTLGSRHPRALTTVRYFAPAYGIPEDPVTGVANAALGGYLAHHAGLDFRGGTASFFSSQGEHVGRPGLALVEVDGAARTPLRTRVGGPARVVAQGQFLL